MNITELAKRQLEQIEKIEHVLPNRFVFFEGWYLEKKEGMAVVTYGEYTESNNPKHDALNHRLYMHLPYASGSDYAGDTVSRANFEYWQKTYASDKGETWLELRGGFDTYGILLDVANMTEDQMEDVTRLLSYPILCEETLSAVENRETESAWEHVYYGEFFDLMVSELEDSADESGILADNEDFQDWLESNGVEKAADSSTLRELFAHFAELANEDWFNEGNGHEMVIRIDGVCEHESFTFANVKSYLEQNTAEQGN